MNDIVQHAITIYEPRCQSSGIQLHQSLTSSRKILLRRGEMLQVISNLLVNSIYALSAGGTIYIDVKDSETDPQGVVFSIRDSGVGIGPEDLPRVFDAFFTTRATIGTGIGLFVAKQIVEGHGGRITIESSKAETEHGTKVHVFLPSVSSHAKT